MRNPAAIVLVASLAVGVVSLSTGTSSGAATGPSGPPGNWTQVFADEFNGTSLDTSRWMPNWYGDGGVMNDVGTYAANVSEGGGHLTLTLAGPNSGALIGADVAGGHQVAVGEYVEASVYFPGNGTSISNWPAWWISGPNWPAAGEHDIAEGLGDLTVNYHSPSGSHNLGAVPGVWSNAFHTYGVLRAVDHADVYWDGQLVKTYPTDDNGQPEQMIFNVGGSGVYGAGSQVLVDWVRAWASGPPPVATTTPPTTTPPPTTSTPPVTNSKTTQPPTVTPLLPPAPAPDPWAPFWQWVTWLFGRR